MNVLNLSNVSYGNLLDMFYWVHSLSFCKKSICGDRILKIWWIFFISDSIVVPEEGSEESTNDPGGPEPEFIKLFKKRQERLKKSGMYVIFAECRYFAAMLLLLRCTIFRHRKQLTKKEPLLSSTSSICVCNFTKNCSVLILKIQRSRFQYLWDYLLLYSKEDRPGDEMLQINSINITWFLIVHFKNII